MKRAIRTYLPITDTCQVMKKILILLSVTSAFLCMAPLPSHEPVEGSLDPSFRIMGNVSLDNRSLRFLVWESHDLKPYLGYAIAVVSSANVSDTMRIIPAADGNGGAMYRITEADRESNAEISFVLTDESGKIISRGRTVCADGELKSMTFDMGKARKRK